MTTSKAIAGAVAAIVAHLLTKYGITLDAEVSAAVNVLLDVIVTGIVGYVLVYLAPRNTTK